MTVTPACRDYQTAYEAREAWEAGEDFRVLDAHGAHRRFVNKEQADRAGTSVFIGFCHLTKWIEVRAPDQEPGNKDRTHMPDGGEHAWMLART